MPGASPVAHVFTTAGQGGDADPPTGGRQPGRPAGHEQVTFCQDRESGLRAIIAIHSTALGPALGGTRFYPYPSEDAALADVLNLSRAMTYKNALAGLDHGGGKAVIIGDPDRAQVRGAAARLRPLRRVAGRPVRHRLRYRHLQRGHGRHRPRVLPRHRPDGGQRRGRRLLGADRPRASSRACGPPRSTPGARPAWPGGRSGSRASARSAGGSSAISSPTAPGR